MSDFNWNGNDDAKSIVLGWQPRTAVYATNGGGIAIRQECDGFSDDRDDQILLTAMGALQVAWKIIEVAHGLDLPKPDRKLMAKSIDLGPSGPPAALFPALATAQAAE
jgi:hypothetical protein